MEVMNLIQEYGNELCFFGFMFVGWLINFTHQKKQYALEKRRDSEASGPLPVEQDNYQEAKYLKEVLQLHTVLVSYYLYNTAWDIFKTT